MAWLNLSYVVPSASLLSILTTERSQPYTRPYARLSVNFYIPDNARCVKAVDKSRRMLWRCLGYFKPLLPVPIRLQQWIITSSPTAYCCYCSLTPRLGGVTGPGPLLGAPLFFKTIQTDWRIAGRSALWRALIRDDGVVLGQLIANRRTGGASTVQSARGAQTVQCCVFREAFFFARMFRRRFLFKMKDYFVLRDSFYWYVFR